MAILYLLEQGTKLVKEQKKLVVEKDDNIILEIPEFKVDRVLLFGNVQITTQAMKFLLESGIETAFFTIYGKLIGKLSPIESKNVFLRITQYECSKDENFRLSVAKILVEGKIKNAKVMLQRYVRNHPEEVDFTQQLSNLDSCLEELVNKTKVSTVLGIEGRASAVYFEAFGKMFRKDLQFTGRTRHPPLDPVNALLSLGYTLITNEMLSIISATGFDPYIGFLHGLEYGRPSLALDLIEEFRHAVVDRLVLELINKEILKEDDFEQTENGIFLKNESRKIFFSHYEKRMLTCFQDEQTKEEINFRKMFFKQVQNFSKLIQEKVPYKPFIIK